MKPVSRRQVLAQALPRRFSRAGKRRRPGGTTGGRAEKKGAVVDCLLCPSRCRIGDGQAGDCRVRINVKGKLYAVTHGRPCAVAVDPIEKKPIFHVLPGTKILSIATAGCNLHCRNCQNHGISQSDPENVRKVISWSRNEYGMSPARLVQVCSRRSIPSIAYTYSEPVVFYEYTYETAELARSKGIRNVTVTAGYINEMPLRKLCRVIDGSNVDLKTMNPTFFRENCGGELKFVLNGLTIAKEEGVWVEVTNLIIPTMNDTTQEIRRLCRWVHKNLGPDTPLHLSRFYPHHQLRNLPPTPPGTLMRARKIAMDTGLRYVYVGNLRGNDAESTYCPSCNKKVIGRVGYTITALNLADGKCRFCNQVIPGVWK